MLALAAAPIPLAAKVVIGVGSGIVAGTAAGEVVSDVCDGVGEIVTDVVEGVGNVVSDICSGVGDFFDGLFSLW